YPVEPEVMNDSTAPVAIAWERSAAWIVTGCAPNISAILAVAGLYERNFTPLRSDAAFSGFLEYSPCGGQATVYSSFMPCEASSLSSAGRDALSSLCAAA